MNDFDAVMARRIAAMELELISLYTKIQALAERVIELERMYEGEMNHELPYL